MIYSSLLFIGLVFIAPDYDLFANKPKDQYIYFTATWCGYCNTKATKDYIEGIKKKPGWSVGEKPDDDFRIVDTDREPNLVTKYNIKSIPYVIRVTRNGNLVSGSAFDSGKGFERILEK